MADWCADLLHRHPPDFDVLLRLDGWCVRVRCSDRALCKELREYFHTFVTHDAEPEATVYAIQTDAPVLPLSYVAYPRAPGKRGPKEEYCDAPDGRFVRKVRTGMVFAIGEDWRLGAGPCRANINQVINFVNAMHLQRLLEDEGILLHAAGVCFGSDGIALAGLAAAGKSTLALHLIAAGGQFVSNDRLVLRREGQGHTMHGVAKMPRVNPGTILNNPALAHLLSEDRAGHFRALPPEELWQVEDKHDADIEACFGKGRIRLACPASALVILTWKRTEEPTTLSQVDLRDRPDLLAAVAKEPGVFHPPTLVQRLMPHTPEAYLRMLRGLPAYELRGGMDFSTAVELCRSLPYEGAADAVGESHHVRE